MPRETVLARRLAREVLANEPADQDLVSLVVVASYMSVTTQEQSWNITTLWSPALRLGTGEATKDTIHGELLEDAALVLVDMVQDADAAHTRH